MEFQYETEHLILKVLNPSPLNALAVLDFYNKNRAIFEQYEAARPENFYTTEYVHSVLTCEYNLAIQKKAVRFWIFEKTNPEHIIGTISFFNITHSIYDRCETGYKLDPDYWHKGYAKEALQKGISIMFYELNLHRIEAYVMEENTASIYLLKSLQFQHEGTTRQSIRIRGKWEDHMLFALLK